MDVKDVKLKELEKAKLLLEETVKVLEETVEKDNKIIKLQQENLEQSEKIRKAQEENISLLKKRLKIEEENAYCIEHFFRKIIEKNLCEPFMQIQNIVQEVELEYLKEEKKKEE